MCPYLSKGQFMPVVPCFTAPDVQCYSIDYKKIYIECFHELSSWSPNKLILIRLNVGISEECLMLVRGCRRHPQTGEVLV